MGTTADGSVDGEDGGCQVECDCPDYARQEPGRFCRDNAVYECDATLMECGWSCSANMVRECQRSCADPEDGTAYCCPVPQEVCPDYATQGQNLYCRNGDLYMCLEGHDPYCGFFHVGDLTEECEGGCIDFQDGNAHCCPNLQWDCPTYLEPLGGGFYCEGDDLYSCGLACWPDCGCSGQAMFDQHCNLGCVDNQDGLATCTNHP